MKKNLIIYCLNPEQTELRGGPSSEAQHSRSSPALTLSPLSMTTWSLSICFISRSNHSFFKMNCVFRYKDLQMLGLKLTKCEFFHTLEVVGRVSNTQLQVCENSNHLILKAP